MTALQELDQFTCFAQSKLRAEVDGLSLEDCLKLWRRQIEEDETVADIEQSMADYAAGRVMSAKDAFDDVRRRLGISQ